MHIAQEGRVEEEGQSLSTSVVSGPQRVNLIANCTRSPRVLRELFDDLLNEL